MAASQTSPRPAEPAEWSTRAATAWHGAWVLLVLTGAAVLLTVLGALPLRTGLALGCGAAPGLLGWLWGPRAGRRPLMVIWTLGCGVAVVVSGGVDGPLGFWCAAPLIVAAVVGGLWREGVFLSFAILGAAGLIQLAGGVHPAPQDADTVWTAVVAAAVALGSAGGALMLFRYRRPEAFGIETGPQVIQPPPTPPRSQRETPTPAEPVPSAPPPEPAAQTAGRAMLPEERLRRIEQAEKGLRDQLRAAMTARAEAEAERDQALAARVEAEEKARSRLLFVAGMSHELRTPLNAIIGFSDVMRARLFGEMVPKYGEYAELIHESGSHLLDLINDVLDMAKIEADRYELRREVFDAREAVNAALRILRTQADTAGIQLRGALAAEEVAVDADPRAIKQIVLNLVANALKFTPAGGSVTVTAGPEDGALRIAVADTGQGIAPEDLERLGRPFEQAGDAAERARGTGLGLSLVKAFAGLHGGEMLLESRLGEGTTVTVWLPVLVGEAAA